MIAIQRRAVVDEYRQFSFQRGSVAFDSRGRLYYPHQARFESVGGRTGVLVEEPTTNLLTANQSSVETDTSGFQTFGPMLGGSTTISRDATKAWHGGASLKVVTSGNGVYEGVRTAAISASANTAYTGSVWVYAPSGVTLELLMRDHTNGIESPKVPITGNDKWTLYSTTITTGATSVTNLGMAVRTQSAVATTFWVDGLQIEQKPYATSWTLGTRSAETLTVPTAGVLYPQEGTIEAWVYVPDTSFNRAIVVLDARDSTGVNRLFIELDSSKKPKAIIQKGATYSATGNNPLSPGWHFVAATWSSNRLACYADGVLVAQYTNPMLLDSFASAAIGSTTTGVYQFNSLIGPLRISRRARTDQEMADAYAAGTLTADADTTLLLPFTGPDAQRGARTLYVPAVGF